MADSGGLNMTEQT